MPILAYVILIFCLLVPGTAASETDPAEILKSGDDPLVIRSETLEIDNKNQKVIFRGTVDAHKSTFSISCKEMHLYYHGDTSGKTEGAEDVRVDRVVATGDVTITRSDGGTAMADKAIYYQKDDKVILTGNPVVKQGEDFVEGTKITFFIGEKKSIVEGSGQKRVRAVIFPGKRKR
ncbi:MAG: lipopolysaccharide transport periplasmic protein LptA [Desulfobacteraceae bacterium]|jgi:lipopolysaccharide export system protein LptA